MRGRRQLVWSRGFKDFAGLVEVTDEEAVESEGDELTEVASVRIDGRDWAIIVACDLRAEILERAEESWIELMFFLQDGLWKGLPF
jgi:asparagine synthetase A